MTNKRLLRASIGRTRKYRKAVFPANYSASYTEDDGPRAAPVIAGNRVFLYNASGYLRCLDFKTGKTLWKRDTYEDFNSKTEFHGEPPQGYFGFASSPLVDGNKVILNVGGDTHDSGIVAFAADTGETVWTGDERAGQAIDHRWRLPWRKGSSQAA